MKPDGLFFFPCSWKKESKRAAADGKIAKKAVCLAKIKKLLLIVVRSSRLTIVEQF